jgi:CheY-like chemotaxis protein
MTRVLVVDDEEGLRQVIAEVLEEEAYEVIVARHGAEAVQIVTEVLVDLIVMDVMMPIMGGIEATHQLRNHATGVPPPIILMSAGQTVDVATLQVGFLRKPFELDVLLEMVATSLNQSARH